MRVDKFEINESGKFNMLYEAIFKRKSVRKYDETQLDEATLKKIEVFSKSVERLYPEISIEIQILTKKDVKSMSNAQHFIAFYSEEKDGYLANAGFMLAQIDLFISMNNIGTCFGTGSSLNDTTNSGLKFAMLLAFGKPKEEVHRKNITDFQRKNISKISNVDNELIQVIKLAPSAMNSQPWYYHQKGNEIDVYIKTNPLTGMMLGKANKVDVGISLCYLWIVVKHLNKEVTFENHSKVLKGYTYIISAAIV